MAEKRFRLPDPLGLFEPRGGSQEEARPRTAERQAAVNQLLAGIRKQIPDEAQAHEEYTRLGNEAEKLGLSTAARTLHMIAQDEARHRRELQDLTLTVW